MLLEQKFLFSNLVMKEKKCFPRKEHRSPVLYTIHSNLQDTYYISEMTRCIKQHKGHNNYTYVYS